MDLVLFMDLRHLPIRFCVYVLLGPDKHVGQREMADGIIQVYFLRVLEGGGNWTLDIFLRKRSWHSEDAFHLLPSSTPHT